MNLPRVSSFRLCVIDQRASPVVVGVFRFVSSVTGVFGLTFHWHPAFGSSRIVSLTFSHLSGNMLRVTAAAGRSWSGYVATRAHASPHETGAREGRSRPIKSQIIRSNTDTLPIPALIRVMY